MTYVECAADGANSQRALCSKEDVAGTLGPICCIPLIALLRAPLHFPFLSHHTLHPVAGYPSWQIDGKLYPGEKSIAELEEILAALKGA